MLSASMSFMIVSERGCQGSTLACARVVHDAANESQLRSFRGLNNMHPGLLHMSAAAQGPNAGDTGV